MERHDRFNLNALKIIIPDQDSDCSTSDSESDGENTFDTTKLRTKDRSKIITSPRLNISWDHSYDIVTSADSMPDADHLDESGNEWSRLNKTDDDKLSDDSAEKDHESFIVKRSKIKTIANRVRHERDLTHSFSSSIDATSPRGLPDVVPAHQIECISDSSIENLADDFSDMELPALYENELALLDVSDLPPPLPGTSPPPVHCLVSSPACFAAPPATHDNEQSDSPLPSPSVTEDISTEFYNPQFQLSENAAEMPMIVNMDSDGNSDDDEELMASLENELSEIRSHCFSDKDEDYKQIQVCEPDEDEDDQCSNDDQYSTDDHCSHEYSDSDNSGTEEQIDASRERSYSVSEEEEFKAILQQLDVNNAPIDTWEDRFAGRRDRFGFILSPVVEAPSPTPSSLSGYSGMSAASPDPYIMFRVSPGPNRAGRRDNDLSSLNVRLDEFDETDDRTVPIYAVKRVMITPEHTGWESGNELISPTGSVEWDKSENGLSSPTVAQKITSFAANIFGWKMGDEVILEEAESSSAEDCGDSDDTIQDEKDEYSIETTEYISITDGKLAAPTLNDVTCQQEEESTNTDGTLSEDENSNIPTGDVSRKLNYDKFNVLNMQDIEITSTDFNVNSDGTAIGDTNDSKETKDMQYPTTGIQLSEKDEFTLYTHESEHTEDLNYLNENILNISGEIIGSSLDDIEIANVMQSVRISDVIEAETQHKNIYLDERDSNSNHFKSETLFEPGLDVSDCISEKQNKSDLNANGVDSQVQLETYLNAHISNSEIKYENSINTIGLKTETNFNEEDSDVISVPPSDGDDDAEDEFSDGDDLVNEQTITALNKNTNGSQPTKNTVTVMGIQNTDVCVSDTILPGDRNSSEYTSEDNFETACQSSFGSGVRVSQYTSGDSDENATMPKLQTHGVENKVEKDTDTNGGLNHILRSIQQSEMSPPSHLDIANHMENNDTSNSINSPSARVLGRPFAEMEDTDLTVTVSTVPADDNLGHTDNTYIVITSENNGLTPNSEPCKTLSDSFTTVELSTHIANISNGANKISLSSDMSSSDDELQTKARNTSINNAAYNGGIRQIELFRSSSEDNDKDEYDTHNSLHSAHQSTGVCGDAKGNCKKHPPTNEQTEKTQPIRPKRIVRRHMSTPEIRTNLPDEILNARPINKRLQRRNTQSPVNISISHLRRNDSIRRLMKSGYVKTISKIFSGSKTTDDLELFKRKVITKTVVPSVGSPHMLTANDNLIITHIRDGEEREINGDIDSDSCGNNKIVQTSVSTESEYANCSSDIIVRPLQQIPADHYDASTSQFPDAVDRTYSVYGSNSVRRGRLHNDDDDAASVGDTINCAGESCIIKSSKGTAEKNVDTGFVHVPKCMVCTDLDVSDSEDNVCDTTVTHNAHGPAINKIDISAIFFRANSIPEVKKQRLKEKVIADNCAERRRVSLSDMFSRMVIPPTHMYNEDFEDQKTITVSPEIHQPEVYEMVNDFNMESTSSICTNDMYTYYSPINFEHSSIKIPELDKTLATIANGDTDVHIAHGDASTVDVTDGQTCEVKEKLNDNLCDSDHAPGSNMNSSTENNSQCSLDYDNNNVSQADRRSSIPISSNHEMDYSTNGIISKRSDGIHIRDSAAYNSSTLSMLHNVTGASNKGSIGSNNDSSTEETDNSIDHTDCSEEGECSVSSETSQIEATTNPLCLPNVLNCSNNSDTHEETNCICEPGCLPLCAINDVTLEISNTENPYDQYTDTVHSDNDISTAADCSTRAINTSFSDCLNRPIKTAFGAESVDDETVNVSGHGSSHNTDTRRNKFNPDSYKEYNFNGQFNRFTNYSSDSDSDELLAQPEINREIFQHTCYHVQIPFNSANQHDIKRLNTQPVTQVSDANRVNDTCDRNPIANANRSDVALPTAIHGEARSSKRMFNLSMFACQNTGLQVNTTCSSSSRHRDSCVNTFAIPDRESLHLPVKNDRNYHRKGVHVSGRINGNVATHQTAEMQNDVPLSENKLHDTFLTSTRINDTGTTQRISQTRMSTGHASDSQTKWPGDTTQQTAANSLVLSQSSPREHTSEYERGNVRIWPYSTFENTHRVPVTIIKSKKHHSEDGQERHVSTMKLIQESQRTSEMPENRMVKKYHSSSTLPPNTTGLELMKTHGESVHEALSDSNGNTINEEDLAAVLPKIAESVANMKHINAEEILPGITQSVSKLQNGGNLVITTMTRKVEEDEDSSGRGSPEPHTVIDVDDIENSKIYLVQDSKGEMFYVEDITSDSQESAYFSSSRNTSGSVSDSGANPSYDSISKIQQHGNSNIKATTAEELISMMYDTNQPQITEINENEEEFSERTYEYEIPRGQRSYTVEEPESLPGKIRTKDNYQSSYEMSSSAPWVYDGGQGQSNYSNAVQGMSGEEYDSVSNVSENFNTSLKKTMQTSESTGTGYTSTSQKYTMDAEANMYPLVPATTTTTVYATPPAPVVIPQLCAQVDDPNYQLVTVDVMPKQPAVQPDPEPEPEAERPIYKTVAHIRTKDKQAPLPPIAVDMTDTKKYKIIETKATDTEVQETQMNMDEVDYRYMAENVEYRMSPTFQRKHMYVQNTAIADPPSQFKTEKRLTLNQNSDQKYKTEIQVQDNRDYNEKLMEESSYTYNEQRAATSTDQTDANMRIVRGSYLIKNGLDGPDGELDDNLNMFDGQYTLCKENPLYQSDEDIYKRYEREKAQLARKQDRFNRDLNQDITFETVDRFSKSKEVKRDDRPKQSLSELLLSRLSTIDSKDIRQHIDVKHHSEDIYGDPSFLDADGTPQTSLGTNNFESVGEKVDLLLKEGKAYITVKVTAERITPIDLEFNVWRKNQAIVTRTIEVDLLATEQRSRLYYRVMEEEPRVGSRGGYRVGPNETVLDSEQTLDLFTRILGASDGGDREDIEIKTRQGKTTMPFSSGMDLMY